MGSLAEVLRNEMTSNLPTSARIYATSLRPEADLDVAMGHTLARGFSVHPSSCEVHQRRSTGHNVASGL